MRVADISGDISGHVPHVNFAFGLAENFLPRLSTDQYWATATAKLLILSKFDESFEKLDD